MTWDFAIGRALGMASVGALWIARRAATWIRDEYEKIPKG